MTTPATAPTAPLTAPAACAVCRVAGQSCGRGTPPVSTPAPCVVCGTPTAVRSACGVPRPHLCGGSALHQTRDGSPLLSLCRCADAEPAGPSSTPATPAIAPVAGVPAEAVNSITAPEPEPAESAATPRLLAGLEKRFPPKRGGKLPFWRPRMPEVIERLEVVGSWAWKRQGYSGSAVVLDRSGAWISAASSVSVAHGALEHTGPDVDPKRPGVYLVDVHPWAEGESMPHPLGRRLKPGSQVLITEARLSLLIQLAREGRWADATVLDSWTGEPARLSDWATHVNEKRAAAIREHGRDSEEYDAVKVAFSQAVTLMLGSRQPGQPRRYGKSPIHRPDWGYAIQDQAAVNLWRTADACRKAAPELGPLEMRNVDELLIPAAALDVVTRKPGPTRTAPVRIDAEGIQLGTYKVKNSEEW